MSVWCELIASRLCRSASTLPPPPFPTRKKGDSVRETKVDGDGDRRAREELATQPYGQLPLADGTRVRVRAQYHRCGAAGLACEGHRKANVGRCGAVGSVEGGRHGVADDRPIVGAISGWNAGAVIRSNKEDDG